MAGLISIGYATPSAGQPRSFEVGAHWAILAAGVAVLAAFAVVLGPTLRFP